MSDLPDWMRPGRSEHEFILDHESNTESMLVLFGILLVVAPVITAATLFSRGHSEQIFAYHIPWMVLPGLLLLAMRSLLKDYHLIDVEAGKLFLVRELAGRRRCSEVADFEDFNVVAVNSLRTEFDDHEKFHYGLVLCLRDGRRIELSPMKMDGFQACCVQGQALSQILNTPFLPAEERKKLIDNPSGGLSYEGYS